MRLPWLAITAAMIAVGVQSASTAANTTDKLLCTTPQAAMAKVWLSYKNQTDEQIASWVSKRWYGETCTRLRSAGSFTQTIDNYTRFNPVQNRLIITWFIIRAWTFADSAFVWYEAIPWYNMSDFIRPSHYTRRRPG